MLCKIHLKKIIGFTQMLNKNVLIFGSGAIGGHLGFCLSSAGLNVDFIARGKHFQEIKKNGLTIKIYNNKRIIKEKKIQENDNVKFYSDLSQIKKNRNYDFIFLMNKINTVKSKEIKRISKFIKKNTSIIPQCTQIPFWLNSKIYKTKKIIKNKDINFIYNKFLPKKKIIGMSAWVSAKIEKPGVIKVKHIQRGYPLKEINKNNEKASIFLRNQIKKFCVSPKVKNINAEIYIKSINALAFNLVALNTLKNNKKLNQCQDSKKKIFEIMSEGDEYLKKKKIQIPQSIKNRIKQTLSSTEHTMSMLTDHLKGKKTEIEFVWSSYYNFMKKNNIKINKSIKIYRQTIKKL